MAEEKIEWDTGGEQVQWDDAPKAPKAPTKAPSGGKDPLSDIGYSTALGGITGLAAPEVAEASGRVERASRVLRQPATTV